MLPLVGASATPAKFSLEDSGQWRCAWSVRRGLVSAPRNGECDAGPLCAQDFPGDAVATAHPMGQRGTGVCFRHCCVACA